MIEISMTELCLLIWAGLATSLWLGAREGSRRGKMVIRAMLENEEFRNHLVADYKEKCNAN